MTDRPDDQVPEIAPAQAPTPRPEPRDPNPPFEPLPEENR